MVQGTDRIGPENFCIHKTLYGSILFFKSIVDKTGQRQVTMRIY
jgi:hypothetical protein